MQEWADRALSDLRKLPVNEAASDFEALVHYIITRNR